MDWKFGSDCDDFMVPKDDELSDMLLSAESWSMWGTTAPEGFGLPKKYFMMDQHPNSALTHRGFCNEFEMTSVYDRNQSTGSSTCGELLEDSLHHGLMLHDQRDYQLDGFSGIEQMDDIFLNSLLEDHPGNEDLQKPFCSSSESQCDKVSTGWEKGEVSAPPFIPCNLEQEDPVKALSVKIYAHHDENSSSVQEAEQASLEESVLQDLERVMAQLTEKTRICFRDGFYRLAKNSEQQSVSHTQHAGVSVETSLLCTSKDMRIRPGRKKAVESETNTIDRAIANLTFNKMDSNARGFQATQSGNLNLEITGGTGLHNHCSNWLQIHNIPQPHTSANDAEVPTCVHRHPGKETNECRDVSRNTDKNM